MGRSARARSRSAAGASPGAAGGRWDAFRLTSHALTIAGGTIRSSLFASTDEAGIPDPVAVQLAEMFATDIDFHRELRRGDTFSVVYPRIQDVDLRRDLAVVQAVRRQVGAQARCHLFEVRRRLVGQSLQGGVLADLHPDYYSTRRAQTLVRSV